jgi:hypothetical protein
MPVILFVVLEFHQHWDCRSVCYLVEFSTSLIQSENIVKWIPNIRFWDDFKGNSRYIGKRMLSLKE